MLATPDLEERACLILAAQMVSYRHCRQLIALPIENISLLNEADELQYLIIILLKLSQKIKDRDTCSNAKRPGYLSCGINIAKLNIFRQYLLVVKVY